jgi:exopolyphosphatase / guanosine-5'-triphosphate,3'-diphosphate pyrophosphatase
MSKRAVIDLGTNTFTLLIANVKADDFEVILTLKEGVALGFGGIHKKTIIKEAFQRGIEAIKKFKSACDEHEVNEIKAIGTSAIRDADNRNDFLTEVFEKTGISIQIISGIEEANLIFKGVSWSYNFDKLSMIMDIGGGSTEFVLAEKNKILELISLNIGVSRIFHEISLNDPMSDFDIQNIEAWLEGNSMNFFDHKSCEILIGSSGSFETFYELIYWEKFPSEKKAIEIPIDKLLNILDWIIVSSQEQRDAHPFIIPIRRKMAPIAAVKTRWVLKKLGVKKVFVSPCSLKEGILKMN